MEFITIKLPKEDFELLVNSDLLASYEVVEVKIKDELFAEDKLHVKLKSKANSAYKELKEYEFTKRNQ